MVQMQTETSSGVFRIPVDILCCLWTFIPAPVQAQQVKQWGQAMSQKKLKQIKDVDVMLCQL